MFMTDYQVEDGIVRACIRCQCGCAFEKEIDVWDMMNTWKGLSCPNCGAEKSGRSLYQQWFAKTRLEVAVAS